MTSRAYWLEDPDAGKDWRQDEKRATKDEMVRWHHWLNGHEFEQTQGESEGQGSLACYIPRGLKESDTTEGLNNSNLFLIPFWISHRVCRTNISKTELNIFSPKLSPLLNWKVPLTVILQQTLGVGFPIQSWPSQVCRTLSPLPSSIFLLVHCTQSFNY